MEVDRLRDDVTEGLVYRSHEDRRFAQFTKVAFTRSHAALDKMKTVKGLFIAAREDSDDWPTSYDYLIAVRAGYLTLVSPKNEEDENGQSNGKTKDSTAGEDWEDPGDESEKTAEFAQPKKTHKLFVKDDTITTTN